MKQNLLSILTLLFILGCSSKQVINSDEIIISAEILTYDNLSDSQKDEMKYGARYYIRNWNDRISFNPQEAFYVKNKI